MGWAFGFWMVYGFKGVCWVWYFFYSLDSNNDGYDRWVYFKIDVGCSGCLWIGLGVYEWKDFCYLWCYCWGFGIKLSYLTSILVYFKSFMTYLVYFMPYLVYFMPY